ncbi:hypothetical protein SISSUDRAFT_414982 [Sistotremastrum suecicum HHB10207 ss-3]|uniref:Mitochondrial outer membrane transport complex Sam37/metaxin N-terminal domain-containing protein n=1 Tax=Sistotremastrum suecicum HHB10207 ss-3 TaxID=1314776 RepID=A0A166FP95_9AGAM|nr:hypothetical protein SISSUDRAFT_414982 [Sistotremastrum suecicum HHB10207 ss-3]
MGPSKAQPHVILHVWPLPGGEIPCIEPSCLAAILHLQLAVPHHYAIEYSLPELSPDGQMPFLQHKGHQTLSTLSGVTRYLSTKHPSQTLHDIDLTPLEQAQSTAYKSYIISKLGDLVNYILFGNTSYFWGYTSPHLSSHLPVPTRYYVPARIRNLYQPRLESIGLWDAGDDDGMPKKKSKGLGGKTDDIEEGRSKIKQRFGTEKILEMSREVLDLLTRLLADKPFIFAQGLTSLDILLAAHILSIHHTPIPRTHIKELLQKDYSALIKHAARVLELIVGHPDSTEGTETRSRAIPRVQRSTREFQITALLPAWA